MRYNFECYKEDGGCGSQFEISCSMSEISELKPKCPECGKKKAVSRVFGGIVVSTTRTLGGLIDKNTAKLSEDNKQHLHEKHNSYRKKEFTGKLGEGMKTYEKDKDGKRISN